MNLVGSAHKEMGAIVEVRKYLETFTYSYTEKLTEYL